MIEIYRTDAVLDFLSDMESTESYYGLNSWLEGASTTHEQCTTADLMVSSSEYSEYYLWLPRGHNKERGEFPLGLMCMAADAVLGVCMYGYDLGYDSLLVPQQGYAVGILYDDLL